MNIETLRRVRSAAAVLIQALDELEKELTPAPEPQRKRRNLKAERIEKYERKYALDKIKK